MTGTQPRTELDWKKSISKRLAYIERMANTRSSRESVIEIPTLAPGASTTMPVVFDTAFANDNYRLIVQVSPSSTDALGSYVAAVVPGSRTATGCIIMVKSTGGVVPAGQSVTVTGVR
ncbi:MAG: hypothetical protein JWO15_3648 [Sphingomonadales bacterium]|nr:hypothetical protein [Sphingomonadales bacterium]